MAKLPLIEIGFETFLADGAAAFGAVRAVAPGGRPELMVNVEGAGDVRIPLSAVEKVVLDKVVVRWDALEEDVQQAIKHTLDQEDFPPADEGEVELEPAADEDEDRDADDRLLYDGPLVDSPPDELPGRDAGARYGTPPSVSAKRRPDGR
jgi:hypothetical protein